MIEPKPLTTESRSRPNALQPQMAAKAPAMKTSEWAKLISLSTP